MRDLLPPGGLSLCPVDAEAGAHGVLLGEPLSSLVSARAVARELRGDIRRMESAVIGIKAKSCLCKTPPDLAMVREVIFGLIGAVVEVYRGIERVVGVAGGMDKFDSILGAVRGRLVNVLITDVDTGVGIAEADRQRIFEPFYTKKVMGRSGTGLGMTVVWGTVKDHQGYILLKTDKGSGTTFKLYFPVTRKDLAEALPPMQFEDWKGKGERVLVIDDVEEQRDIAFRMLTRLGYEAHTVSSGEEGIEYLKTHSADLLLLDMIMDPGMDGLDT